MTRSKRIIKVLKESHRSLSRLSEAMTFSLKCHSGRGENFFKIGSQANETLPTGQAGRNPVKVCANLFLSGSRVLDLASPYAEVILTILLCGVCGEYEPRGKLIFTSNKKPL